MGEVTLGTETTVLEVLEAPRWAGFQGWDTPWGVAACGASGSAGRLDSTVEGRRLGTACFVFLSSGISACPFAGELCGGRAGHVL